MSHFMVEITTLGIFSIKINSVTISDSLKKTSRLIYLLNLLIVNANKPMSTSLICDILWKDNDHSDHKALQNLIYRLRNIFTACNEQDCIIYSNNTYMLTPGPNWKIDSHLMEDYYNKAKKDDLTLKAKIELLEKAADLYGGEHILNLIGDNSTYFAAINRYELIYTEIVNMLSDLYSERKEYDKIIHLCYRGIQFKHLQESFYLRIAKSMNTKGEFLQALKLLDDYIDALDREMGVTASKEIFDTYSEISRSVKDINSERLLGDIAEVNPLSKTLLCSRSMFKDFYMYEVRQLSRRKKHIYLTVAEIEICDKAKKRMPDKALLKFKNTLHESCYSILRQSDVFADISESTIIIMFGMSNESGINRVLDRLKKRFNLKVKNEGVTLKFDSKNVTPYKDIEDLLAM